MKRFLFIVSLLFLTGINTSIATTVMPISLERMAKTAAVVFYGRVISNQVKFDELSQRVATFTRFEVLQAIKGVTGDTYTVKQIGGRLPGSNVVQRFYGVPRFIEHQEYIVFLPEASRLGFASPIGLAQGSFEVSTEGNQKVVNTSATNTTPAAAARGALAPDNVTSSKPGKPLLSDFLQQIHQLSAE
jgi:hypothetical protein